ncbi:hypothetical protein ACFV3E_36625 [Streptomyces sp. NPDC059718]
MPLDDAARVRAAATAVYSALHRLRQEVTSVEASLEVLRLLALDNPDDGILSALDAVVSTARETLPLIELALDDADDVDTALQEAESAISDGVGLRIHRALAILVRLAAAANTPRVTEPPAAVSVAAAGLPPGNGAVGVAEVLHVALRLFQNLVGRDYAGAELEPSREVLEVIWAALPQDVRRDYTQRLEAFAAQHQERLEQLYQEFGPHSPLAGDRLYALVREPVSLVLCEHLTARPMWLAGIWQDELPDEWLQGGALAWNVPLP